MEEILEKAVFYDRRVVTYKWLSWKLGGHPNTAKQCLRQFLMKQKAEDGNVAGHSIITGTRDGSYRVILTASVRQAREKLSSVTGVHLYSVCPANLPDAEEHLQTETNPEYIETPCLPIQRTGTPRAEPAPEKAERLVESAEKAGVEQPKKRKEVDVAPSSAEKKTKKEAGAGQPKKAKQADVASLFAEKKSKKDSSEDPTKKGKQADVASLFAGKSLKKETTEQQRKQPKQTDVASLFAERKPKKDPSEESTKKAKPADTGSSPAEKKSKKEDSAEKSEEADSSEKTPKDDVVSPVAQKKRKRRAISESSEDESAPTPSASMTDSGCKTEKKRKRKVMKAVKETYKDDEGFLVTKTVKQLVSESDDEEPLPKVKEEKKVNEMKQQTLFSFLKKK
ncbi:DNA polymerase delta subunit 3-like [Ornithodoros turicata]|uniref:DNA polymerase delta subunit 3-like n=1 Tax=Ornithodoros turicata TaxID=34597 RepID=UPI0031389538